MSASVLELETRRPPRQAARPARRTRAARPSADAGAGPEPDLLRQYLRSIRDVPVLDREAQTALAREFAASNERFRELAMALPGVAPALWRRWHARKAKGRSSAPMSIHYRDGSGRDHGAQIDEALTRLGQLLELDANGEPIPAPASVHRDRIAPLLQAAEIATPWLVDALKARSVSPGAVDIDAALAREAQAELDALAELRARFTLHNTKLVVKLAKRFRNMGVPFLDLIQEGNRGLIRAVELFDAERGNAFSTYAVWWINQSLIRALQTQARSVRIPSKLLDLGRKYRETTARVAQETLCEPGMLEMAEALGVDEQHLGRAVAAEAKPVSIHAPLPGTDDLRLGDTLEDPSAAESEDDIDRQLVEGRIREALRALPERERTIIEQRFGMGELEPRTLQAIADDMGVSRERVRQLESRALEELRRCAPIRTVARELELGDELAS